MNIFRCDSCNNLLFFENVICLRCGRPLGFFPNLLDLCALEQKGEARWQIAERDDGIAYRRCKNGVEHPVCNWMVPDNDPNPLCQACRLNLIVPDLTIPENITHWQKLEWAKRRVIYTFLELRLTFEGDANHPPLRFKFMADVPGAAPVMTGHSDGVITINLAEADNAERERLKRQLHEPFRTLLGHLRHETAHYFWDELIGNTPHLERFRRLFGDERADYGDSLKRYYASGPPADWQGCYVTAYASSHPWEDWAESWAHFLHIIDAMETAASFGLHIAPKHSQSDTMRAQPAKVSNGLCDFEEVIRNWIPLTHALNEVNRGMGLPDLYPFILSNPATEKLRFVHEIVRDR